MTASDAVAPTGRVGPDAPDVPDVLDHLLRDRGLLARRQIEADRVMAAEGAGHLVHGRADEPGAPASRPWRLDPVPLVVDGATFDGLAAAVTARMAGIEALLGDLYGARRCVAEGLVPAEALAASPRYRMAMVGTPPPLRWLTTYAVDLARLDDGSWRIVQDLTDAPTGIGFALIDRSVMARVAVDVLGAGGTGDVASLSGFQAELRHALTRATPVASPRVVLFSGGIDHPAYVEHSFLARRLGFHLVEGPDLVVRKRRLWLRTLGGLDPIDVVYRRVDDAVVDPIEIAAGGGGGVPGLLFATAEGGVVLANAHGAGVVQDPELAPRWSDAVAALTGRALPFTALGGDGDRLAAEPVLRDGELASAPVVVRLHAIAGPDGIRVMPGGNGRVLGPRDDPRTPSPLTAKDVWVLAADRGAPVVVGPHLPQVDLTRSVPTRAADSLFWVGRAAERAEAIARTARVVAALREQDPTLVGFDGGRWSRRMAYVLASIRAGVDEPALDDGGRAELDESPRSRLAAELDASRAAVAEQLGAMVTNAVSVGEYFSTSTGRVIGRLARLRDELADTTASIDALDAVVAELAAFAGLWNESTVRGPAWRFGDIGRRVERAMVTAVLVEACVHGGDMADVVEAASVEVLLAAAESLVAYRRHHRSDVELGAALALVVEDPDNPRSFAAAVRRLGEHAAAIDWPAGVEAAAAVLATLARPAGDVAAGDDAAGDDAAGDAALADRRRARLADAHRGVHAFADLVERTWFATPVNPVVVRPLIGA